MKAQFILFASNKEELVSKLSSAGYYFDGNFEKLFEQLPWPEPGDDGNNNPWQIVDRNGKPIKARDERFQSGFGLPFQGDAEEVEQLFRALDRAAVENDDPTISQIAGIELSPVSLTTAPNSQNWCAGKGLGSSFGMRRQARGLIGAETLTDNGLTGAGVKILVVDQGVNQHHINKLGGDFGGGFKWIADGDVKIPGQADIPFLKAEREHGSLMARSLISLAPDAEIWDLPLIPRQIDNISSFTLGAAFAYQIVRFITLFIPGPWVIVNAWGIDSRFDEAIWGDYSNNKNHPLNVQIGLAGQKHDIVFAAGNSGQFGPDPQAGPYDRGPGRSIFGANGHADVTSVGAVRTDAVWIGASSQGPGPSELAGDDCGDNEKPDLCAPGWFLEDRDSALRNGGTSTASAIVAGVLGALRQIHSPAAISPAEIRAALRSSARKFGHTGWNGRMGEGVLNVPGAVDALKECGGHDAKPVS